MATRVFNLVPSKSPIQMPTNWHTFMLKVIDKAERTTDRRLPGLRKALVEGQAEKHLRLMGIICEADISREFPG